MFELTLFDDRWSGGEGGLRGSGTDLLCQKAVGRAEPFNVVCVVTKRVNLVRLEVELLEGVRDVAGV